MKLGELFELSVGDWCQVEEGCFLVYVVILGQVVDVKLWVGIGVEEQVYEVLGEVGVGVYCMEECGVFVEFLFVGVGRLVDGSVCFEQCVC